LNLADCVAIVSQGGSADIRKTVRERGPLKACVAYFPETYGDRAISLALRILARENVPLTNYTSHVVLTPANVEQYYPAVNN
jgi:ribose transport system substrate-binding protein